MRAREQNYILNRAALAFIKFFSDRMYLRNF